MEKDLREKLKEYLVVRFNNIKNIREISDDIIHEAYVNCRKSKTYEKSKENFGYLSKVCYNIAIKYYKKQQWENDNIEIIDDFNHLHDDNIPIDDYIIDKNFVKETLKKLKVVEEKILHLRYYERYSFAEICKETGIKLSTVLSHHRRALLKLKPEFSLFFSYGQKEPIRPKKKREHHHYSIL